MQNYSKLFQMSQRNLKVVQIKNANSFIYVAIMKMILMHFVIVIDGFFSLSYARTITALVHKHTLGRQQINHNRIYL